MNACYHGFKLFNLFLGGSGYISIFFRFIEILEVKLIFKWIYNLKLFLKNKCFLWMRYLCDCVTTIDKRERISHTLSLSLFFLSQLKKYFLPLQLLPSPPSLIISLSSCHHLTPISFFYINYSFKFFFLS